MRPFLMRVLHVARGSMAQKMGPFAWPCGRRRSRAAATKHWIVLIYPYTNPPASQNVCVSCRVMQPLAPLRSGPSLNPTDHPDHKIHSDAHPASQAESNSLKSGEKSSGMFNYLQFQRLEIQVECMIHHECLSVSVGVASGQRGYHP